MSARRCPRSFATKLGTLITNPRRRRTVTAGARAATLKGVMNTAAPFPTIRVEHDRRGWEVELPGRDSPVTCRTLHEAQRLAYQASRRQPCELVICDAYHRVTRHELIGHSA